MELIINEMLTEGYYYKFLDSFREKLREHSINVNHIRNEYLTGDARCNPASILYSIELEFEDNINTHLIVVENPHFMHPKSQRRINAI